MGASLSRNGFASSAARVRASPSAPCIHKEVDIVRRLPLALAAAAAAVIAASVTTAEAGTYTPGPLVQASGASPFAGCTVGAPPPGEDAVVFPNTEIEPWIEVNPQNANDVVAFWQQDRWSDGGAHGLVAGVSDDGGATWAKTWPKLSECAGGTAANGGNYERSSDPWLSWSKSPSNGLGTLHAISISFDRTTAHNAVLTSRSLDGGFTWSNPITLREDNSRSGPLANRFNDRSRSRPIPWTRTTCTRSGTASSRPTTTR
jgi:hypothetical protein